MTPDTQQARHGYRRPPERRWDTGGVPAPGPLAADAARAAPPDAGTQPSHTPAPPAPPAADAGRAGEDASIVRFIPLLAVLAGVVAGVCVAWQDGSSGAGAGGAIAGAALLAGAALRLLLPARRVGLLATRKRATDVVTLTVFGASLLVAGLVLPH